MQATISVFDPATRTGELLLDDGVRLPFAAAAMEGNELLHLRPGQRVHLEVEGTEVRALSIMPR